MADLSKNVWGTKSKSKWNVDDEEPEDILYPTMNGIKDEIKKQSSPLKSNSKKKTGAALGESIYDDYDDDYNDTSSKQTNQDKEKNSKFEEAAEILYKYPLNNKSEKSELETNNKPDADYEEEYDNGDEAVIIPNSKPGSEIKRNDKDGILTGAAAKVQDNNENILKILDLDKDEYQVNGNVISKKAKTRNSEVTADNQKNQEMKAEASRQRDLNIKAEREKYLKTGGGVFYGKLTNAAGNPLWDKIAPSSGIETIANLQMSKADSYMNTNYAKKHKIYNTYKDAPAELQEYLKEKISNQIGKDKLETTKGIYVDKESTSSKSLASRLMKEESFIKLLKNYETPMNNKFLINDSISFKNKNWHYALGNADIRRMHIDKNGNVELYITDTYDFNKGEKKGAAAVGRKKQEDGEIRPYFSVYHVVIPKEERDKALKKY